MNRDRLFLLKPHFMDGDKGPYYCPHCAQTGGAAGVLSGAQAGARGALDRLCPTAPRAGGVAGRGESKLSGAGARGATGASAAGPSAAAGQGSVVCGGCGGDRHLAGAPARYRHAALRWWPACGGNLGRELGRARRPPSHFTAFAADEPRECCNGLPPGERAHDPIRRDKRGVRCCAFARDALPRSAPALDGRTASLCGLGRVQVFHPPSRRPERTRRTTGGRGQRRRLPHVRAPLGGSSISGRPRGVSSARADSST